MAENVEPTGYDWANQERAHYLNNKWNENASRGKPHTVYYLLG
jgi:hypothetical protein